MRRKRKFILTTTYYDNEAHTWQGDRDSMPAKIRVYTYNYRHAVLLANRWIRERNSEFNGYELIPVPPKGRNEQ